MRTPKFLLRCRPEINPSGEVGIGWTSEPASTTYQYPAWWAFTAGRNPDIEIAGPCATKNELIAQLRVYKAEGRY